MIPSKTIISHELGELWQHLDSLQSPVVFCHNDLSHLNIIYNRDKGSLLIPSSSSYSRTITDKRVFPSPSHLK